MEIRNKIAVIIPTLCRDTHFKRCFESLERCTGAENVDIYIALDYPPSEKYMKGWKEIDSYLKQKEVNNHYANLHVIRRNRNYGVGHPHGNYEELQRELQKKYAYIVLTEDDNEFSPCFLDYMYKCFERFKDDPRFILICGYNHNMEFPDYYKNNYYISNGGCAWGIGKWSSKSKGLDELYNLEKLGQLLKDKNKYEILKERCPQAINMILTMLKTNDIWGDSVIGIYAHLYDKFYIIPRVSMVRNYGNDASGIHSRESVNNDYFISKAIDLNYTFYFTNDIFTYKPMSIRMKSPKTNFSLYIFIRDLYVKCVRKLDLYLYRHFSYIPKSKWL